MACADFLRDNLHLYLIREPSFPWNPKMALRNGFRAAEKFFLENAVDHDGNVKDKSGSCAVICLIVGDMCYIANVGDSRAIMSGNLGKKLFPLSRDHKPNDPLERKRIETAGGSVY